MKASILIVTLLVFSLLVLAQQRGSNASDTRQPVTTKDAPAAVGPSSQAVKAGDFIFVSGQLPFDPASGEVVGTDNIALQTDRALRNLDAILRASGSSMNNVVRTTVYLNYMSDLPAMNEVYKGYFTATPPARSVFQVEQLPRNVLIEIDAVALR